MASTVLTDCNIFVNQLSLGEVVTEATVNVTRADVDCTTFSSDGNRERKAGIEEASFEMMGFYDTDRSEAAVSTLLGTEGSVASLSESDTAGAAAYFARGTILKADRGFPVGSMAKLDTGLAVSSPEGVIPGRLLAPVTVALATANGTGNQLGAVSATQSIYAALHVFFVSGTTPSMTVTIQSDDNAGFTSATDRITFTANTALGFEMKSLAGAITDTYWRARYTLSGTSPIFVFAVVAGIK